MIKKVTIKDIAKELDTTYSTVSRALNNNPRISEETRKVVIDKAKQMGYQPNSFAQQLKKGYSNTIGLVVPRINRVFFSNVIHGVETIAKQNGFNVIICQSNENVKEEENNIQTLLSNNIAGVIMSISRETRNEKSFKPLLDREIPLVMFDRTLKDLKCNQVVNNNFLGAYELTSHLIQQGYSKIAHFTGSLYLNVYQDRLNGYKQALKDHHIKINEDLIIKEALTKDRGYEATKSLITQHLLFDAIFAASDYSALGSMLYLQEQEIEIPNKIGIAGFANEPFTELIGLTTVEQYSTEIGASAARILLEEITSKDETLSKNQHIEIKPKLIIRKSTNKKI